MQDIGARLREQGFSDKAVDLSLGSWRPATQKSYNVYLARWKKFAVEHNISDISPSIPNVCNFLAFLFEEGIGHSAINSARSALSVFCKSVDGYQVGKHPNVCRLVKGVFEQRPSLPRYVQTWDVGGVLQSLSETNLAKDLSLKELTLKLSLLLSLVTGQRGHALHLLKVRDVRCTESRCVLVFSDKHKTTRPGFHTAPIVLETFENPKLCVVKHIIQYLYLTKDKRTGEEFFISIQKPHAAVARSTFSRWIKLALSNAGVDMSKYGPHSTRAASTSAASMGGTSINEILKSASWASGGTFQRFYLRDVEEKSISFSQSVLSSGSQ